MREYGLDWLVQAFQLTFLYSLCIALCICLFKNCLFVCFLCNSYWYLHCVTIASSHQGGHQKKLQGQTYQEVRAQRSFEPRWLWVSHNTFKLCYVAKWRIGSRKPLKENPESGPGVCCILLPANTIRRFVCFAVITSAYFTVLLNILYSHKANSVASTNRSRFCD